MPTKEYDTHKETLSITAEKIKTVAVVTTRDSTTLVLQDKLTKLIQMHYKDGQKELSYTLQRCWGSIEGYCPRTSIGHALCRKYRCIQSVRRLYERAEAMYGVKNVIDYIRGHFRKTLEREDRRIKLSRNGSCPKAQTIRQKARRPKYRLRVNLNR